MELQELLKDVGSYKKIEIVNYESSTGAVSNVVLDMVTTYSDAKCIDKEELRLQKDIQYDKDMLKRYGKERYDDLWVDAYDALYKKSTLPNTSKKSTTNKVKINKGIDYDGDKGVCYITGFIIARTEVGKPTTIKKSNKRDLTIFKDYITRNFLCCFLIQWKSWIE